MAENISDKYIPFKDNESGVGLKFLQGDQAALNTLISSGNAIEGAFYLTSDTSRIYIGRKLKEDNSKIIPVAVNEGVTTVASVSLLPNTANVGDFYYTESENILCVCSSVEGDGTSDRVCTWVQLNTNSHLTANSLKHILTGTGNQVGITTEITDSSNNKSSAIWNLVGGENITVSFDNNTKKVTLTAKDTKYTFSSKVEDGSAYLVLNDGSTDQQIKLSGNRISITGDTPNELHLIGQNIQGITVGDATPNGWNFSVKVDGTNTQNTLFDPVIQYGSIPENVHFANGIASLQVYTINEVDKKITDELSKAAQTFDAMTFKGVINEVDDLPALTKASNGDTYKIGESNLSFPVNLGLQGLDRGDLVIAVGTEDPVTGLLDGTDAHWEIIPSGDEANYNINLITHGITLTQGVSTVGGITLAEGGKIVLTDSVGSAGARVRNITVSHAPQEEINEQNTEAIVQSSSFITSTSKNALSFYVLDEDDGTTGIERDEYGHIIKVKTKKITVNDSHNQITVHSTYGEEVANNTKQYGVALNTVIKDSDQRAIDNAVANFISDSIEITSTNTGNQGTAKAMANISLELKWGTF